MLKLSVVFCFLVLAFNVLIVNLAFAQDSTPSSTSAINFEGVSPSNVVSRLSERISLFFKFSSKDKVNYQKKLTEKRLAELKYAVDNEKGDLVEELASRYSTYVGRLTDMVVENKMTDKKQELIDMYDQHYNVVVELDKKFEANSGLWLMMEHDKNYLKIYSEQLKNLK